MRLWRIICTAAAFVLCAASVCFAQESYSARAAGSAHIEMWHYSGNYWQLGNFEGYTTKITDAQLSGIANIQGYLNVYHEATFRFRLSGDVLESILDGGSCDVELSTALGDSSRYYDMSSLKLSLELPYLVIKLKPRFNIVTKVGYDSYIAGLKKYIPLVDIQQGVNLYAVYLGTSNKGAANGYFNQNSLMQTQSLRLHPGQIKDNTGTIQSGIPLALDYSTITVNGHKVGSKTFVNAGAVGMDFRYMIFADITSVPKPKETPKPEESETSTESSGAIEAPAPGPQEGGTPGPGGSSIPPVGPYIPPGGGGTITLPPEIQHEYVIHRRY